MLRPNGDYRLLANTDSLDEVALSAPSHRTGFGGEGERGGCSGSGREQDQQLLLLVEVPRLSNQVIIFSLIFRFNFSF
jgi:hypothetical protein